MQINVNGKDFKKLQGVPVQVKKVYSFYRTGYVPAENKFHTYIPFPIMSQEVIYSWDNVERKEGEETEMREQTWNKEIKKFEFRKVKYVDRKAFPKVIDIIAVANAPFEVTVWDSTAKARLPYLISAGEEFTLQAFSSWKVRDLLETFELDTDVEVNTENKKPFDWEDAIRKRLEGKAFTFRVTGSGLETRYKFKEVAAFAEEEIQEVAKPKLSSVADKVFDTELTIDSIPF